MSVDIALIAAGRIAESHVTALSGVPDAAVTAVVDPDLDRARAVASEAGAEAYADYADVVAEVDAVYLLTPPRIRVEIVRAAAAADTAIFCEKPLAATIEDGREIADIVEESGLPFMMGFCQRYREPYVRLRELARDGTLGRPLHYFSTRMGAGPPGEDSWREDPDQACGMTIESLSHDLDLLRWLGGEVVRAHGEAIGSRPELAALDDSMGATLRYESGAVGALHASWNAEIPHGRRGIVGTEGTAVVEGDGMFALDRLRWRRADGTDEGSVEFPEAVATFSDDVASTMSYREEGRAFVDALRAGDPMPIGVHDGMRALELAHEILSSSSRPLQAWTEQ